MAKMTVVNAAVAGSREQADAVVRKWKKKYSKVTVKKHKTDKSLQKSSPGRYGPYWYEVTAWSNTR